MLVLAGADARVHTTGMAFSRRGVRCACLIGQFATCGLWMYPGLCQALQR